MIDQIEIRRLKERTDTLDFGATLAIILGTPAALAVAKGIHDFISKNGSRVTIRHANGTIIATGDGAKNIDVAAVIRALSSNSLPSEGKFKS